MRAFAAATAVAVAAAILAATALVISVVGTMEASGALVGRSVVTLTDLPYGLTKSEQVRNLTSIATDSDVSLAMLVPDRHARPDVWTAYVFRGRPVVPVLRGELDVRPIGDGADLDLRTTFAVGGSAEATERFLEGLGRADYKFVDDTPRGPAALLFVVSESGTLAALVATALGIAVALIAESARRSARQGIRRTVGWSRRRVAAREAAEMSVLVGALVVVSCVAVAALLTARAAGTSVWSLTAVLFVIVLVPVGAVIICGHVLANVLWVRELSSAKAAHWPLVVVTSAAIGLVVLSVLDIGAIAARQERSTALERTLVAESAHGDDVVLGTGFTDFDQDVAFGKLALGPLARGDAGLAQVSFVESFTVVGDVAVGLSAYNDEIEARPGPVLLVPEVLAPDASQLRRTAEEELAAGWEVEGRAPPRERSVRAVTVASTADITESVIDWTGALRPEASTWPDIPVLVVPDPTDIAPNRIGTAVANGEVRFADRRALLSAVDDAGLSDVVLQVRRVGATVEGQLAMLRSERLTAMVAALAALAATVFTASALVVEHRVRSRVPGRVLFLSGRNPVIRHRRFALVGVGLTAAVTAVTLAFTGHQASDAGAFAVLAGVLAAGTLSVLLAITGRRERT